MIQPLLVFSDFGILILRVVLGLIVIAHGFPKITNLRGAVPGFEKMGFRPGIFWATIAAFAEFIGGIALVLGVLTQFFALLLVIEFAIILVKLRLRPGARLVGGYELDLLVFAAALILATLGGGVLGLDSFFGLVIY